MKISFVIPAFNEESYLGKCLGSILQQTKSLPGDYEILVINNASTDKTKELALSFSGVKVVDEPQKGLTKARQKGLLSASGEILAFVDADSVPPRNWLSAIIKEFSQDPKLVCLSGPYIYYDIPKWQQWLVKNLYYNLLARAVYFFTKYMASGGNLIIKKTALLKIGGFDTQIDFYGEDTDIARRLHEVGHVKFLWNFFMYTSGRRLNEQGTLKTGATYVANYTSVMLAKKPLTKEYNDIR